MARQQDATKSDDRTKAAEAEPTQGGAEDSKLVLSLSGGGVRATLFHLGVFVYLAHTNQIKNIKGIVAVSGGSILAAHFAKNWQAAIEGPASFRDTAGELVRFIRCDVRHTVLIPWLWSRLLPWSWWRRSAGRTARLERAYRRLFGDTALGSLAGNNVPRIAIVATDSINMERVAFTPNGLHRFQFGNATSTSHVNAGGIRVSLAVAASSCFPPVFPRMHLDHRDFALNYADWKGSLALNDGGVADNLGTEILLAMLSNSYFRADTAIIVDAERPQIRKPFDTLMADVNAQAAALSCAARDRITTSSAIKHCELISIADRPSEDWGLSFAAQTKLAGFRTDLDAPSWREIYALVVHGAAAAAVKLDGGTKSRCNPAEIQGIVSGILAQGGDTTPQRCLPEESDLAQCHRRPMARVLSHVALLVATSSLLLSLAIGAVIGTFGRGMLSLPMGSPEQPASHQPHLKRMEMYLRRNGDDGRIQSYLLVKDGAEEDTPSPEPLTQRDDFKLMGTFDGPVYWYLLWFDTGGKVTIQAYARREGVVMEYPTGSNYVPIDPTDPAGIHLLLLVAGTESPDTGVKSLKDRLGGIGKPPGVLPPRWSQLRGSGQSRPGATVPIAYLAKIEAALPPTLRSVHALFVRGN